MARRKKKQKDYSLIVWMMMICLAPMVFVTVLAFVIISIMLVAPFYLLYIIIDLIIQNVKNKSFVNSNMNMIDSMTGERFEDYVAKVILPLFGYTNISTTKHSGDFGADILADCSTGRIAIQCKRFKGNVGVDAIQEVVSSKSYYGCNEAAVFTNSYFTKAAIKLANVNNVILSNRDDLLRYLNQIDDTKLKKRKKRKELLEKVKDFFKDLKNRIIK